MIDNLIIRHTLEVISKISFVALKQRLVRDYYVHSLVLLVVVLEHNQSDSCNNAGLTRACRDFPHLSLSMLQLRDRISTDCTLRCVGLEVSSFEEEGDFVLVKNL